MNMPNEPINPEHSPRHLVIDHLLESIAQEDLALANILNAQAAKIHAFVGKDFDFPTHPSNEEIISLNNSSMRLLRMAVMKEWLALSRLEEVVDFDSKQTSLSPPTPFNEDLEESNNVEDDLSLNGEMNEEENNVIESSRQGDNDEFAEIFDDED